METLPVEMRRMIMEHLSNAELRTISLVNKLFNYEARSLMSIRANLNAHLRRAPCENVLPFVSHLKEMNVIPFSGIKIRWWSQDHCTMCSRPHEAFSPVDLGILDRVAWKRFSVVMDGNRQNLPRKCPAMQLVQKLIKDFSTVLEVLELSSDLNLLQFVQGITQDQKFPQLKILKLHGSNLTINRHTIEKRFIKEMVARAPNLQEFHQDGRPDLSENLLEGSSSAVLVSNCDYFNPAQNEFSEGFTGTIKLKEVDLYYEAGLFSMEAFKTTVPRILESSFDTLHCIRINLVFLVPLMGYGGLCLQNVAKFLGSVDYARWKHAEPRVLSLIQQFDFTRVFPKLQKICLGVAPDYDDIPAVLITEFVTAAVLEKPSPDRAMNIKHALFYDTLTAESIPFFAGMFPNVQKLATAVSRGGQVPYAMIWKHWLELKEIYGERLTVNTEERISTMSENLDSDFCGIFPAEVALLREQDDEYLRAVHIVPVMPSVNCLSLLRTIRMVRRYCGPYRLLCEEMDPVFSKVTAFIVFQRCRNLVVDLQTNSQQMLEALSHLKPYAAVQLLDREIENWLP